MGKVKSNQTIMQHGKHTKNLREIHKIMQDSFDAMLSSLLS